MLTNAATKIAMKSILGSRSVAMPAAMSPFSPGKNIVFTGTLSQTRKNMTAKAEEAGSPWKSATSCPHTEKTSYQT
eukprot:2394012-Amphidinium_carterae.1